MMQDVGHRPESISDACGRGWRLRKRARESLMGPDKMVVGPPRFEVEKQVLGGLGKGPGFAHERSDTATEGEVDALNECSLNIGGKALGLQ